MPAVKTPGRVRMWSCFGQSGCWPAVFRQSSVEERAEATGLLRLLSPTECVKDRLAGYFYFGDEQCLQQALLVARRREVDMAEVGRWARNEGQYGSLRRFRGLLKSDQDGIQNPRAHSESGR